jgi:hypothetical protein
MQEIKNKFENLENEIRERINSKNFKIKPKWHFILKGAIIILSALFFFLSTIFFTSFLIFKNRALDPHAMRDILFNINTLPIILLTILVFILSIVFILHTKYNFVYKKPAYITISILFVLVLVFGFIADKVLLHDRFEKRMQGGKQFFPGMKKMYENDFGIKEKRQEKMQDRRKNDQTNQYDIR